MLLHMTLDITLILSRDPPHMHPAEKIEGLAGKTMVNGQVQNDEMWKSQRMQATVSFQ